MVTLSLSCIKRTNNIRMKFKKNEKVEKIDSNNEENSFFITSSPSIEETSRKTERLYEKLNKPLELKSKDNKYDLKSSTSFKNATSKSKVILPSMYRRQNNENLPNNNHDDNINDNNYFNVDKSVILFDLPLMERQKRWQKMREDKVLDGLRKREESLIEDLPFAPVLATRNKNFNINGDCNNYNITGDNRGYNNKHSKVIDKANDVNMNKNFIDSATSSVTRSKSTSKKTLKKKHRKSSKLKEKLESHLDVLQEHEEEGYDKGEEEENTKHFDTIPPPPLLQKDKNEVQSGLSGITVESQLNHNHHHRKYDTDVDVNIDLRKEESPETLTPDHKPYEYDQEKAEQEINDSANDNNKFPDLSFFDPTTSTAEKGRKRVADPRLFDPTSLNVVGVEGMPGISILMGHYKGASEITHAITCLFDRSIFCESEAQEWWESAKSNYI